MKNKIARIIFTIAIITFISGIILAFAEKSLAVLYLVSGFISGSMLLGFAEIIEQSYLQNENLKGLMKQIDEMDQNMKASQRKIIEDMAENQANTYVTRNNVQASMNENESVKAEVVNGEKIRCSFCGAVQRSNRSICMICGKKFE